MNILGINAYHGNASAAIVSDGRLIAAVEEERFNRVKYAAGFPAQAIRYCLKEAGLTLGEIDHVAVPRNPYARLGTKLFYSTTTAKKSAHNFIASSITKPISRAHFSFRPSSTRAYCRPTALGISPAPCGA